MIAARGDPGRAVWRVCFRRPGRNGGNGPLGREIVKEYSYFSGRRRVDEGPKFWHGENHNGRVIGMRRLLLSSAAVLLLAVPAGLGGCALRMGAVSDAPYQLEILHTNDTHSYMAGMDQYRNACLDPDSPCVGGAGRLVAELRRLQAGRDNVLALDAGDRFQGTLLYTVNQWPMLADLDALLGYDAMTLGNHEFDEGCETLADFIRALNTPVLAANLVPGPTCPLRELDGIRPYEVRDVAGRQVGIVGLANPDVDKLAAPCRDMRFADSAETLRAVVAQLEKKGVDIIVAVTHLGLAADRALARAVEGVDIIVGGHSHSWLASGDTPGSVLSGAEGPYPVVERSPDGHPVLVVTAKYGTEYLGDLHVSFDGDGVPISWGGAAERLEASIPPAPDVTARLRPYAETLDQFRSTVLGEHHITYVDGMDACRSGDCLAGMLQTDAMLDYGRAHGAVAALSNGGSLRAPLKAGPITRGDVLAVMPFGNALVIREYSGADLLAALEFSAGVENGKGARLLQSAGLRYRFDPARPEGQRLIAAELVDDQGRARLIRPEERYKVVLLDFLARGGDGYDMLTRGAVVEAPDPVDVDVFAAYVRAHSPLSMPRDGRILKP